MIQNVEFQTLGKIKISVASFFSNLSNMRVSTLQECKNEVNFKNIILIINTKLYNIIYFINLKKDEKKAKKLGCTYIYNLQWCSRAR